MKIALAQQNYHIGNFEENRNKIIDGIEWARNRGAELVVFSELCVCGYPPRDFLEFSDFVEKCHESLHLIKEHTADIGVLVGCPAVNRIREGKDLFNAVFLLHEKEVKAEVHKTLLPNYDIFDEYRYFEPAYEWNIVHFKGRKIAVTICEDIWNMGDNPLYRVTPMEKLMPLRPEVMINLSASPYNYAQDLVRNSIVRAHVLKYGLPMLYCNTVGSQTEIVFDGGSLVYDAAGRRRGELKYFEEDYAVFDLEELLAPDIPVEKKEEPVYFSALDVGEGVNTLEYLADKKNIAEIFHALVLGIRDYFRKMGFSRAILGASGGIDSAVTQALASEALGAEQVRAVLMPSRFSSSHSISDAQELSRNLGNPHDVISIDPVFQSYLDELEPLFRGQSFGIAEENIQSRVRGNLLMALANKFHYILLNTSNKSELATGYGTLYGDMAGGLSVLGDIYKTQVYALAHYINEKKPVIPQHIFVKEPSAELRPGQKDADSLPEYSKLDRILYEYIELRRGPSEIIGRGHDPELVRRVLKLVNTNEYKRNQFCPIIRVSTKAFGIGRRVPIVGKYLS
ncbi:MAG TPA: NAD+ synthase [Chitinophagaceae bacterium]|nr:NAD+ synthase [Chitinophagaceae bacterium]